MQNIKRITLCFDFESMSAYFFLTKYKTQLSMQSTLLLYMLNKLSYVLSMTDLSNVYQNLDSDTLVYNEVFLFQFRRVESCSRQKLYSISVKFGKHDLSQSTLQLIRQKVMDFQWSQNGVKHTHRIISNITSGGYKVMSISV